VTLRPPLEEDAAAVAELVSLHSPERTAPERVLQAWTAPGVDLARDARVGDGEYGLVEDIGGGRVLLTLNGWPSPALLEWAEARAAETAARVLSGAWDGNEPVRRALEEHAFRAIRHSYRMLIDLDDEPEAPRWPARIEVQAFEPGDERTFYEVHQETFADHWEPFETPYDEWRHYALQPPIFEPESWLLALDGDEPAAFAICHVHPTNPELGWIGALGVRRPWRRLGLGRALLLQAFGQFRRSGLRQVGLGVDAENLTGANRLYESAGMRVSHHFDIYEKRLGVPA
jgi:ribosomal protein S18 acetylase RimI-like enzyme